jgi:hypothetical protein
VYESPLPALRPLMGSKPGAVEVRKVKLDEGGRSKEISIARGERHRSIYIPLNGVAPLLLDELEPVANVRLVPDERETAFHARVGFTGSVFGIGDYSRREKQKRGGESIHP